MSETAVQKERVILAGVDLEDGDDFERSMKELQSLAEACHMEVVGILVQKMDMVNKALYMGKGKVEELAEFASMQEADIVVFDNALSPSQLKNLQQELKRPVMDRTALILEIFSGRARTREAKLQVETARLQYLLPRLVGMHEALSRQGGGSGLANKGAGEKKLELDRRRIEHRLAELRRELEEVVKERETQRKKRMASHLPLVALVGYTNAGKSTLMNSLLDRYMKDEEKKVLEKDMLFATLETTVRKIETPEHKDFLLSDTVGFIHKLPTALIKAFRSTLEEIKNADLILQVIDFSDSNFKKQMEVTEETLHELGAGDIPVIYVYNKADLCMDELPRIQEDNRVYMSAKSGVGLTELVQMIANKVFAAYHNICLRIPYEQGGVLAYFMENSFVESTKYEEEGIILRTNCSPADCRKYSSYIWEGDAR